MKFTIKVDGETYEVEVDVAAPEQPQPGFVPPNASYQAPAPVAAAPASASGADEKVDDESKACRSPISGVVIRVDAEPGQTIDADETLMVLEAMKMETVITAPIAGTIKKINHAAGDPVKVGQVLIEFE
ncbi:acetyl-CoA carboxylase biotin carboxyl carrier protein subunit [Rhodopirellula sallentina]|uniref:Biotin/lipoyl attachment domain-containing protein n=1 Tax=Rhodopirellula sallentina SM41 TaxID=1263870 RepID=M5U4Y2_9BACT|nr:biotin/lipoyl-containing protein [Rhodopirellula sallentina]EMI52916.1 biotin/lipoyl attachment domain-containing protein [Rhodopirellula sallentina SM41]